MKNFHRIIIYSLSLISLLACSVKKDKMINRNYHALTARDNKYFNANVLFNETISQYKLNTREDFGEILNIREVGTDAESKALYAPLETVIEKCSDVVKKHSMKFKGKEKNYWIDETFLLLGKAHFYKQDYDNAAVVFNYASNFDLQDEKVTNMIWAAETQIMLENYSIAEKSLTTIIEEEELRDDHKVHILEAQSEMYKRLEDYEASAIALEKTIKYLSGGSHKTRNLFIIGQLFYAAGNTELANEYFVEVGRKGRDYEYVFNALLYQAKSFDPETDDPNEILLSLDELADLPRNKDYKDQIYFAKANLYERIDEMELALENYDLAIESHVDNDKQLIRSHLAKGELDFKEGNYDFAQNHYDKVMELIDEKYPNYRLISEKAKALNDLARLYTTIDWNDSLVIVADWTDTEQKAYATSVAEREKFEKEQLALEAKKAQEKLEEALSKKAKTEDGAWYFGNSTLLKKGKKLFAENWGYRKHEDHWRRENKSENFDDELEEEIEEEAETEIDSAALSELEKRILEILDEIPENEKEKLEKITETAEAYYELGMIYKEYLDDFEQSIEVFEQLLVQYKDFERKPAAYYQLYRLYALQKDKENSEKYKNLILTKYPNTLFSDLVEKIITNTQAQKDAEEKAYQETFELLKSNKNTAAKQKAIHYLANGENEDFKPKYALILAEAHAGISGREEYVQTLKMVVDSFPETPESETASERLSLLESNSSHFNLSVYNSKTESAYYLVLLIEGSKTSEISQDLSNFKNATFSKENLVINTIVYDESYTMVSLKVFKDVDLIFDFIKTYKQDNRYLKNVNRIKYVFPITTTNYSTFYKRKNIDEYKAFYDKYLKTFE
ncbi:MAG: tetratricopeptide repeat protein [Flavobacteriales bacterium]